MFSGSNPGHPEKAMSCVACVCDYRCTAWGALGHDGTVGRLLGSGNTSGSRPYLCPCGSVRKEVGRVVWKCPIASLDKDTKVTSARANVTVRGF